MISILRKIIRSLPPSALRLISNLQWQIPILRPLMQRINKQIAQGVSEIVHGVGKGLKIDTSTGYAGYALGTIEPLEQEILLKYLKKDGHFYDIGSNIGFFAIIGARIVGKNGNVTAFEPFTESAKMIKRNADLNQFTNVTVVQSAVSDFEGTTEFSVALGHSQTNRIGSDTTENSQYEKIKVPVTSVDHYVKENKKSLPSLVMIDAEGVEVEVMRGMEETIDKARPVIMCEVHWIGEKFTDFVNDFLIPRNYRVTTYDGKDLPQGIERYHALIVPNELNS